MALLMIKKTHLKNLQTQIVVFLLAMSLLFSSSLTSFAVSVVDAYPEVSRAEALLFGKSSSKDEILTRLTRIEKSIFHKSYVSDDVEKRITRIEDYVIGSNEKEIEDISGYNQQPYLQDVQGYENVQTEEIDKTQFIELLIEKINLERSFKGLLTVKLDAISNSVAEEHASELLKKGYLSYFNAKKQGPDERYTLAGGTGAISEVLNGFHDDKAVKLTELLAKQLIQAIDLNTDDSNIMYSPYVNEIGCGVSLSKDKKNFVVVLEFISKGGDFEPLKPVLNFAEKLAVKGKVLPPYKFKAVSIAYYDKSLASDEPKLVDENFDFSHDQIFPYFPPQNYIAFGDLGKTNLGKVLKGLGVIAAIGGAPFTGGATAILASPLLCSIQNGPPKEIPLKGGIKVNSQGEIYGELELNYQGKGGLYFISILAELPGVNAPIVISRRTVRVNSPLPPAVSQK